MQLSILGYEIPCTAIFRSYLSLNCFPLKENSNEFPQYFYQQIKDKSGL